MKIESGAIIALCTTIIAPIAGVATIMSTIRYMKSENSKVLKEQSQILVKIEDGQEKRFAGMAKILAKIEEGNVIIAKVFERIESKIA